LSEDLYIRIANADDTMILSWISAKTFSDSFSIDNKPEDIEKHVNESYNPGKIRNELNDALNVFFLAYKDGVLAGYAKLNSYPKPESSVLLMPIELERIYVLNDFKGMAIGKKLLFTCIEYGRNLGRRELWLGVWERNYNAISFYESFGFRKFGEHPFVVGNDVQNDLLMVKEI